MTAADRGEHGIAHVDELEQPDLGFGHQTGTAVMEDDSWKGTITIRSNEEAIEFSAIADVLGAPVGEHVERVDACIRHVDKLVATEPPTPSHGSVTADVMSSIGRSPWTKEVTVAVINSADPSRVVENAVSPASRPVAMRTSD